MKIHSLALCIVLAGSADAFAPQHQTTKPATSLQAQRNDWFGPAAVAAAGWAMAAQLSFAGPVDTSITVLPDALVVKEEIVMNAPVMEDSVTSSTMTLSAFGAPGKFSGQSFETVDFSLPSYDEAVGGKATAKPEEAPKFTNPFGSFDSSSSEETESKSAVDQTKEDKQAEREAAKARKAEEKAEAEAKKAEEKAAAEKAKADKEARRKEQLELQRAAVERQKEAAAAKSDVKEDVAPSFSMPEVNIPDFKAPEMPKFEAPKFEAPKFEAPKFEAPKFEAPKFEAPKFDAPKLDVPSFEAPKFEAPSLGGDSKLELPKLNLPSAPSIPEFKAPELPKVSLPSLPSFGGGGESKPADVDADLEPQEVRDSRAKEARSVFLEYDKIALDYEKQARDARNEANNKKKIAKDLKNEACKTRPGGKFLCLRPFGSGY